MSRDRYFRFYLNSWAGETFHLSAEERGVYISLICLMTDKGRLVSRDEPGLHRVCRTTKGKLQKAIDYLLTYKQLVVIDGALWAPIIGRWKSKERRAPIPDKVAIAVYYRDNVTCVYCGDEDGPHELDHVIPRSRGGPDTVENIVVACRSCNRKKSDRTPQEMGWCQ